jgi:hypothetical protein
MELPPGPGLIPFSRIAVGAVPLPLHHVNG